MIRRLFFTVLLASSIAYAVQEKILDGGHYTAKVTAMPCGGCVAAVEKAILAQPGVKAARVDLNTTQLIFIIKEGSTLPLAMLQKSLKEASDSMGMGADYRLLDLQKITLASYPEALPSPPVASDTAAPGASNPCEHGCSHH